MEPGKSIGSGEIKNETSQRPQGTFELHPPSAYSLSLRVLRAVATMSVVWHEPIEELPEADLLKFVGEQSPVYLDIQRFLKRVSRSDQEHCGNPTCNKDLTGPINLNDFPATCMNRCSVLYCGGRCRDEHWESEHKAYCGTNVVAKFVRNIMTLVVGGKINADIKYCSGTQATISDLMLEWSEKVYDDTFNPYVLVTPYVHSISLSV